MKILCPKCNQHYDVEESLRGMDVSCQKCGEKFYIPLPETFEEEKIVVKRNTAEKPEETIRCPSCGEKILAIAKKCRFCGEILKKTKLESDSGESSERKILEDNPHRKSVIRIYILGVMSLFVTAAFSVPFLLHIVFGNRLIPEEDLPKILFFNLILIFIFLGITILLFWYAGKDIRKTVYTLTNKRIIVSYGVFTSNSKSIMIKDIRNLEESQSLFQKFFDVATLSMGTAGTAGIELSLIDLKNFSYWKAAIEKLMKENRE